VMLPDGTPLSTNVPDTDTEAVMLVPSTVTVSSDVPLASDGEMPAAPPFTVPMIVAPSDGTLSRGDGNAEGPDGSGGVQLPHALIPTTTPVAIASAVTVCLIRIEWFPPTGMVRPARPF
jgi:hypothetical protein